ncbi:MAG TPA: ferritin-like domain-containing protein [Pirellulaceae bacterium]
MGFSSSTGFTSLEDLFVHQLNDLYDAEQQSLQFLPKMIDKATSPDLRQALTGHLHDTKQQLARLEKSFHIMGLTLERVTCVAMKGLVTEGEEIIDARGDSDVVDAALIAAAQRMEHCEIAGYGTARSFANQLGFNDIAKLLQQSLDEEGQADKELAEIAEQSASPVFISS